MARTKSSPTKDSSAQDTVAPDAGKKRKLSEASQQKAPSSPASAAVEAGASTKKAKLDTAAESPTEDASEDPAPAPKPTNPRTAEFICTAETVHELFSACCEMGRVHHRADVLAAAAHFEAGDPAPEVVWAHVHTVRMWRADVGGEAVGTPGARLLRKAFGAAGRAGKAGKVELEDGEEEEDDEEGEEDDEEGEEGPETWWELTGTRDEPEGDGPALEVSLQGMNDEASAEEGTWWITEMRMASAEGQEAILQVIDHLDEFAEHCGK